MKAYAWNPAYSLVMKIKNDYVNTFGILDTYDFQKWLSKLDKKEYNDILSHLKAKQVGNNILIRYDTEEMDRSMWTDPESIFRECRSVVIDVVNDELVIVPFRKFFNLNEVQENSLYNIEKELMTARSVEITDKLDGSMQCARYYKGEIVLTGSMALDRKNSWRLGDGYSKLTKNHLKMIAENPDFTFIFEYISIRDSHVVTYKPHQEGMYLIGIRNVFDGRQLSYKEIKEFSIKYGVFMTKIEGCGFDEIIEESKKLKSTEKEGWVINIDGHMVKLKCDDYVNLHRVLNKFSSVNTIIKNVADNTFDDLISKVPHNYRKRIESVAKLIYGYMKSLNDKIEEYYKKAPKNGRKEYMIWVTANCPIEIQGYMRQKFLEVEYHVLKTCYLNSTRYKKVHEMGLEEALSVFTD
jgi:T4 RnlA family RNA ligase